VVSHTLIIDEQNAGCILEIIDVT